MMSHAPALPPYPPLCAHPCTHTAHMLPLMTDRCSLPPHSPWPYPASLLTHPAPNACRAFVPCSYMDFSDGKGAAGGGGADATGSCQLMQMTSLTTCECMQATHAATWTSRAVRGCQGERGGSSNFLAAVSSCLPANRRVPVCIAVCPPPHRPPIPARAQAAALTPFPHPRRHAPPPPPARPGPPLQMRAWTGFRRCRGTA